jgi:hypothetical protein
MGPGPGHLAPGRCVPGFTIMRPSCLPPFAPYVPYNSRQELASHVRSALAPIYDFRKPIDKVRDRIAARAEFARAA